MAMHHIIVDMLKLRWRCCILLSIQIESKETIDFLATKNSSLAIPQ